MVSGKVVKTGQTADVLKKEPTGIPNRLDAGSEGQGRIKGESGVLKDRVLLTETERFPSGDQERRMRSVRMGISGEEKALLGSRSTGSITAQRTGAQLPKTGSCSVTEDTRASKTGPDLGGRGALLTGSSASETPVRSANVFLCLHCGLRPVLA